MTIDLRSFQLGVLKGAGFPEDEILRFAAVMHTEPTVRYAGPPIGCAEDQGEEEE